MSVKGKFHISADGVARKCQATKQACKLGISEDQHYTTREEAQAAYEKQRNIKKTLEGKRKGSSKRSSRSSYHRMTPQEKVLHKQVMNFADQMVRVRVQNDDLSLDKKADPERMAESLERALEYAKSQENIYLAKQLSTAKIFPTSVIKKSTGERFSSEDIIKTDTALDYVERNRQATIDAILKFAPNAENGKYTAILDNGGKVTITVSNDGVDQEAFEKLPENIKAEISTERVMPNVDLIREKLDPELASRLMTDTQVLNYVNGSPAKNDYAKNNIPTVLEGDSDSQKVDIAARNLANVYDHAAASMNSRTVKNIKGINSDMKSTIKQRAAYDNLTKSEKAYLGNKNNPIYVPGRSRANGVLISRRQNVDFEAVNELLTDEQKRSISSISTTPSITKARKVLSSEDFGKIFNRKKVSIRVTEKD